MRDILEIERESIEPIALAVTDAETGDDVEPTECAFVLMPERPSEWTAVTVEEEKAYYVTEGDKPPGVYGLYAKFTEGAYTPVFLIQVVHVR
jgi:hypothetical protein